MIEQTFKDVYDEELAKGAIINDRHPGFKNDYLALHILLRKYKIRSCFECGTYVGWGTEIIKNALGEDSVVYSLDLPDDEKHKSDQHPLNNPDGKVGSECKLPFIQLRGDSTTFDYSKYPCDAYWVDAEHSYFNVFTETSAILRNKPKLIAYHDADSENVFNGAMDALNGNEYYEVYRVVDTRILYFLKKNI